MMNRWNFTYTQKKTKREFRMWNLYLFFICRFNYRFTDRRFLIQYEFKRLLSISGELYSDIDDKYWEKASQQRVSLWISMRMCNEFVYVYSAEILHSSAPTSYTYYTVNSRTFILRNFNWISVLYRKKAYEHHEIYSGDQITHEVKEIQRLRLRDYIWQFSLPFIASSFDSSSS